MLFWIKNPANLWKELNRRRVIRGIAAYGATTLVILESTQIIYQAFGIEKVPQWVVWVLGIGFFASLWFSWIYDITPGGIKKTEPEGAEKIPIVGKELKTYKATTFFSVLIIIGILSFRIIDGFGLEKVKELNKSIAVLPYVSLSADKKELQVFDFIGSEIASCLSKIDTFKVIPWAYTKKYVKANKSYSRVGKDLSASILVEWEVYEIDNQKKLLIGLIPADDENLMWSKRYDLKSEWVDICTYSSEITKDVARKLRTFISMEERAQLNDIPISPMATFLSYSGDVMSQDGWELYLMGNSYIDSTIFENAIELYSLAIEYDPDLAQAYANRAKTRSWGIYTGRIDISQIGLCMDDIEKAFDLQPDLTEANIALAFYYYYGIGDFENALLYFKKASDADPSDVNSTFYLSLIQRRIGNWDEVESLISRVLKANPRNSLFMTNIGYSYNYLHNFEKAVECHNRAIELIPGWDAPYDNKIESLLLLNGNTTESRTVVEEAREKTGEGFFKTMALLELYDGRFTEALDNINYSDSSEFESPGEEFLVKAKINYYAGNTVAAKAYFTSAFKYYSNLIRFSPNDSESYSKLGIACAGLGNRKDAIEFGLRATRLTPVEDDAINGPARIFDLLRIYSLVGETDLCLKEVNRLNSIESAFSSRLLLLDPDFIPLQDWPGLN